METKTIRIRNLKGKLPKNCKLIHIVSSIPKKRTAQKITGTLDYNVILGFHRTKVSRYFMLLSSMRGIVGADDRFYCIKEDEIIISKVYSKFLLFRWWQRLFDIVVGEKIVVTYFTN